MSDPVKQQMLMQRGGFPWALAGLLPLVLGNGSVENQMKTTRDPIMQRGGLSVPPALISKGLPLLKQIGAPLALGALASLGDNVVDKIFGDGMKRLESRVRSSKKPTRKRSRAIMSKKRLRKAKPVRQKSSVSSAELVGRQLFEKVKSKARRTARRLGSKTAQRVKRTIKKKGLAKMARVKPAAAAASVALQTRSLPQPPPPPISNFTRMLQDSIRTTSPSSSHIGQAINI